MIDNELNVNSIAKKVEAQDILSRLLASENITVLHSVQFHSASFDVANRVLRLPAWDVSADVYKLFVGHEIGHALFTPDVDTSTLSFPFAILNIVEDVRIEKLIRRKYLGLARPFKCGYDELLSRDFFGIKTNPINKMGFLDRMNVFTKSGMKGIPFTTEEWELVKATFETETFEEVMQLCEKIANFIRAEKTKQQQAAVPQPAPKQVDSDDEDVDEVPSPAQSSDEDDDDDKAEDAESESSDDDEGESDDESSSAGDDEGESDDESSSAGDDESESDDESDDESADEDAESESSDDGESDSESDDESSSAGDDESDSESSSVSSDDDSDTESESSDESDDDEDVASSNIDADTTSSNEMTEIGDEDTCITAQNFAAAQRKTLDHDTYAISTMPKLSKESIEAAVVPYATVAAARKPLFARGITDTYTYDWIHAAWDHFDTESNNIANLMAREFNMKKAAERFARARTSRSGNLNVKKLYDYKVNDNIFKRVTTFADAKSHGMVMFVDQSSSMSSVLPAVMNQVIITAKLCRKVGIPFRVYSFTSADIIKDQTTTGCNLSRHMIVELLHSDMNNVTFANAAKEMFYLTRYNGRNDFRSQYDVMRGTPLTGAMLIADVIAENMKTKYRVQKMHCMFLSDGEGNEKVTYYNAAGDSYYKAHLTLADGTIVRYDDNVLYEKRIMQAMSDRGINTICYFITTRKSLKNIAYMMQWHYRSESWRKITEGAKEFNKTKMIEMGSNIGFNHYTFLNADIFAANTDTSDDLDMGKKRCTANNVARAFISQAGIGAQMKLIASRFIDMIA